MIDGYKKATIELVDGMVNVYFDGQFVAQLVIYDYGDEFFVGLPDEERFFGRTIREAVGNWLLR